MNGFMTKELTTEDRWTVIEQYFLGNDEWVHSVLTSNKEMDKEVALHSVKKAVSDMTINNSVSIQIENGNAPSDMGITNWRGLGDVLSMDLSNYENRGMILPNRINFQVKIGQKNHEGLFLWEQVRLMILTEPTSLDEVKKLQQTGWLVQFVGKENFQQMCVLMEG